MSAIMQQKLRTTAAASRAPLRVAAVAKPSILGKASSKRSVAANVASVSMPSQQAGTYVDERGFTRKAVSPRANFLVCI